MNEPPPSLYDWAGGSEAITRMIDRFYDRVEHDDLLAAFFPGGVGADHRKHVATWWCEVFGGPADYTSSLGGYHSMLEHHLNLEISAKQRFRFASLMSLAADDASRPMTPPSSALRSSATSNGVRGWRCTTRNPGPTSSKRLPFRSGAGA